MLYSYSPVYIQSTIYRCTKAGFFRFVTVFLHALQVPARGTLEANPKAYHWSSVHSLDRICFCCSVRAFALHFPQLDVSSAFASTRNQQVVPLIFSFCLRFLSFAFLMLCRDSAIWTSKGIRPHRQRIMILAGDHHSIWTLGPVFFTVLLAAGFLTI